MWQVIKTILNKNNSPAWNRLNNIMSIWKMSENLSNNAKQYMNNGV